MYVYNEIVDSGHFCITSFLGKWTICSFIWTCSVGTSQVPFVKAAIEQPLDKAKFLNGMNLIICILATKTKAYIQCTLTSTLGKMSFSNVLLPHSPLARISQYGTKPEVSIHGIDHTGRNWK